MPQITPMPALASAGALDSPLGRVQVRGGVRVMAVVIGNALRLNRPRRRRAHPQLGASEVTA